MWEVLKCGIRFAYSLGEWFGGLRSCLIMLQGRFSKLMRDAATADSAAASTANVWYYYLIAQAHCVLPDTHTLPNSLLNKVYFIFLLF